MGNRALNEAAFDEAALYVTLSVGLSVGLSVSLSVGPLSFGFAAYYRSDGDLCMIVLT